MAELTDSAAEEGRDALIGVLRESQRLGFIGASVPLETHLTHAEGFIEAYRAVAAGVPQLLIDLGSGGGLPGLVVAAGWPDTEVWLIDATQKRVSFLESAVRQLGFGDRVRAMHGRAEDLAQLENHREQADVVVARSFGSPAVTAECASGFLRVGGHLVVSEPPDVTPSEGSEVIADRWDHPDELAGLGLEGLGRVGRFQVLVKVSACPTRFPRRAGVPAKRPLF